MKTILLFICFLSLSSYAQVDIGGVPGTVNQIENDPAQRGFEREYEELYEVVDELDEPEKESEEVRPSHHKQDEPYQHRIDEN